MVSAIGALWLDCSQVPDEQASIFLSSSDAAHRAVLRRA